MTRFPGLGQAALVLAVALALQAGVAAGMAEALPALPTLLRAGLANLVALGAVAGVAVFLSGEPIRWKPTRQRAPFLVGLVLTVVGATIVLGEVANLVAVLLPMPADLASLFNALAGSPWPTALFVVSVVAPLTEEALFRGLLLRGFVRRWGEGPALFLSSALFALFHLNVWQAPTAFLAGLFLGWLCLRTGTLFYAVLAHALFNGVPVILATLGFLITGYNTPLVPGVVEFQPLWWLALGALSLAGGLAMTRGWAPLSPPPDSDTVAP